MIKQQIYRYCSRDNFWPAFQITFILAQLMALIYRLPDQILVNFCCDLDLEFSWLIMGFAISQPKIADCQETKKQTYQLNSTPQMWQLDLTLAMTLTLNFQGQIWKLLNLSQNWFDCPETKSKHSDCTQGLKSGQWVWSWPWNWPRISYFPVMGGPIDIEQIGHELVILDHGCDLLVTKVRFKDLPDNDQGDFRYQRAVD